MGILSSIFGSKKTAEELQAEKNEKNFEILKYDGIRARNARRMEYAIKCFEQALTLKKDNDTYAFLASVYITTGQLDKALSTLKSQIEMNPENGNAYIAMAQTCFMQEDYTEMDKACQKVIKLMPEDERGYYMSGQANHRLGNDIQAIVMLSKALTIKEDFAAAYQLRAETLTAMHQANQAMKDIDQLLGMNQDDEDALLLKAEIVMEQQEMEKAQEILEHIVAINPFNEKAYLQKANLLLSTKKNDEALSFMDEAIELIENSAALYQKRGEIKLMMGDKAGSVEDVKKAVALSPEKMDEINNKFNGTSSNAPASIY